MNLGPEPIRILAVDDHPLFRQGIAGFLADQEDRINLRLWLPTTVLASVQRRRSLWRTGNERVETSTLM